VTVKADLSVGAQFGDDGFDAVLNIFQDHRPGGVDHVDALATGVGHDPGLPGQQFRGDAVGHHQEPDRLQTDLASQPEMLNRHVGLGAVGGDAHDRQTDVLDEADVVHRADARHHQRGDLGLRGALHSGFHQRAFVGQ
jgi:hypothetical protein